MRPAKHPLKLFIFDRDKTLVRVPKGIKHLCGDDPLELIDGAVDLLSRLKEAGVHVVVATNQPGVEDSACRETLGKVREFHNRLQAALGPHHADWTGSTSARTCPQTGVSAASRGRA